MSYYLNIIFIFLMGTFCAFGENELMGYLKKDNILLEVSTGNSGISFFYLDLKKKEYSKKNITSVDGMDEKFEVLTKGFEPVVNVDKVKEQFEKGLKNYKFKRDYEIQVYKKNSNNFIVIIEEYLSLFVLDFIEKKKEGWEHKKYSSIEALKKAIKEIPREYILITEDTLDSKEYNGLCYIIDQLQILDKL